MKLFILFPKKKSHRLIMNSLLLNERKKGIISNEYEVSYPSEAKSPHPSSALVKIIASLRVTYTIFHNLPIVNTTS